MANTQNTQNTTTSAQGNIWLNNVHKDMVHENTSAAGKKFANISFDCPSSASGLASVSVNIGQVFTATAKDGTPKESYRNILLGKPGTVRKVSIKMADGTYSRVDMSVDQIKASFEDGRKAYRAAHPAAAPAVATAETEAAAPAAAAAVAGTTTKKSSRRKATAKTAG